jgi:hypothetical protein
MPSSADEDAMTKLDTKALKLTDTQLVMLSAAAQRDDRLVVLPGTLKGGAAKASLGKLLTLALIEERPVRRDEPHWRTEEEGGLIGLAITTAGLKAIGVEDEPTTAHENGTAAASESGGVAESPTAASPRAGSKQALVLALLSRSEGASLDELVAATGWLPHTTRAALTGLRQKGHPLVRTKGEVGSVYRIRSDTTPADLSGTDPTVA